MRLVSVFLIFVTICAASVQNLAGQNQQLYIEKDRPLQAHLKSFEPPEWGKFGVLCNSESGDSII